MIEGKGSGFLFIQSSNGTALGYLTEFTRDPRGGLVVNFSTMPLTPNDYGFSSTIDEVSEVLLIANIMESGNSMVLSLMAKGLVTIFEEAQVGIARLQDLRRWNYREIPRIYGVVTHGKDTYPVDIELVAENAIKFRSKEKIKTGFFGGGKSHISFRIPLVDQKTGYTDIISIKAEIKLLKPEYGENFYLYTAKIINSSVDLGQIAMHYYHILKVNI